MDRELSPGLILDIRVGDEFTINPNERDQRIVVSIEHKSGQRVRVRIQSPHGAQVRTEKKIAKASEPA